MDLYRRIHQVKWLLIFFTFSNTCLGYQKQLEYSDLLTHTSYFNIKEGLQGEGAELLKSEIGQSQFILFGELHNSRQSALFFNELIKEAAKHDYNKFIAEVGQQTAKILMEISDQPDLTKERLKQLYQKYGSKNNRYPIPFFKGEEDADFLMTARNLGYDLWGIDQEFALAFPMLFDELASLYLGENDQMFKAYLDDAKKAWGKISEKSRSCQSLNNAAINSFFQLFQDTNLQAQQLVSDIRKSWEIYCYYESGDHKSNNSSRIAYMKENLQKHLEESKENGNYPKALIKMGSYHTTKVKSPIGYEDIGHWIDSLSSQTGSKSLHIRYMRRYWLGKDKLNAKDYASVQLFMSVGKSDQWALIDLRPIREKLRSGEIKAKQPEINEIFNHDIMLIAPMDRWVKNNF